MKKIISLAIAMALPFALIATADAQVKTSKKAAPKAAVKTKAAAPKVATKTKVTKTSKPASKMATKKKA